MPVTPAISVTLQCVLNVVSFSSKIQFAVFAWGKRQGSNIVMLQPHRALKILMCGCTVPLSAIRGHKRSGEALTLKLVQ